MRIFLGSDRSFVTLVFGLILRTSLGLGLMLTLACSSKNCRLQEAEDAQKSKEKVTSVPSVKVYKYDGSLQCGMGKSISLENMKVELKGIKVLSASHKNDGLMRIQLCGSPTGNANVYEIAKDDLEKAIALGFREWAFD